MSGARNKKRIVRLAIPWLSLATAQASVDFGIDLPASQDYSLLEGKRVGLVTNQTGVNSAGTKTRLLDFRPWCEGRIEGSNLTISPGAETNPTGHIFILSEVNRAAKGDIFRSTNASRLDILSKICGGNSIETPMRQAEAPGRIIASSRPNEQEFRRTRQKYLLY